VEAETRVLKELGKKILEERDVVAETITTGVENWEVYQRYIGYNNAYDWVLDTIKTQIKRMNDPNFQDDEGDDE
jgi:hypothetical protein